MLIAFISGTTVRLGVPTVPNSRCHNGENPPRLRCNFAATLPFNETSV